mmetsp:Transcript_32108/g.67312  ORF Transcript_32108/g.67312 Transcript_32108/m.67312 type:complete len:236 (-) Transcript_32108:172-879(-)
MSPITLRIDVTKVEAFVKSLADTGDGDGDLARHEGGSTAGRLVVEEDAIGQVHAVGFAIVDENPECVLLCHCVGRTGVEGRSFGLGNLLNFSVKFGSGGLVETACFLEATGADGIEHSKDTNTITVSSVLGHVERNLHVTHGTQIVNFIRLYIGDDCNEIGSIAQVTIMEEKLDSRVVTVAVNVIDAASIERRRATNNSVNSVTLRQQKFSQIGAILSCNSSDKCNFSSHCCIVC